MRSSVARVVPGRSRCSRSATVHSARDGALVQQRAGIGRHEPDLADERRRTERVRRRRRRRRTSPDGRAASARTAGAAASTSRHRCGPSPRRSRRARSTRSMSCSTSVGAVARRDPAQSGDAFARRRRDRARAGAIDASRSRSGPAARRASRTDRGSGDHPARRASVTTGGATGASAIMAAGPRRARRRSTPTTPMRVAYCTTRSSRCSASSTVRPRSSTSRVRIASTSSAAPGSSAEVGSSSTSTRGDAVSTEPIATRCASPDDSVPSVRRRSGAMPSRSRTSSTRRRMTSGAMPRFSIAYASSSSTVSVTKLAAGFWPTTPTRSASSRGGDDRSRCRRRSRCPSNVPPVKWGTRPFTARSSVDLPAPVSPTTRKNSPSSTVKSTSTSAGAVASGYVNVTCSKAIMRLDREREERRTRGSAAASTPDDREQRQRRRLQRAVRGM